MPSIYDDIDLRFVNDFLLGSDGDLKDDSEDTLLSLIDQCHDIMASALGDWELYPNRAASLDQFIGEPNNKTTGERIHDRVRIALTSSGVVSEDDLEIKVIPVHIHRVLIILSIFVIATPLNKLSRTASIKISYVFDSAEQQIYFLDTKLPE